MFLNLLYRCASRVSLSSPSQAVLIEAGQFMMGPPGGTFDLAVSIRPPQANAVCAMATPLMSGVTMTAQEIGDARTVVVADQHGYAVVLDPLHIVGLEDIPTRKNGHRKRR